jgi:phosphoribosylanthranilate isomerase
VDEIRRFGQLVLAGGLTPGNVAEAMGILKPWGVDVASGVEARPGKKDPEKVRAFVQAVRDGDRKTS